MEAPHRFQRKPAYALCAAGSGCRCLCNYRDAFSSYVEQICGTSRRGNACIESRFCFIYKLEWRLVMARISHLHRHIGSRVGQPCSPDPKQIHHRRIRNHTLTQGGERDFAVNDFRFLTPFGMTEFGICEIVLVTAVRSGLRVGLGRDRRRTFWMSVALSIWGTAFALWILHSRQITGTLHC